MLTIDIQQKSFARNADKPVIADLQFSMAREEFVAVVGPSGCGKSTLLHLIAGLDTAFDGRIEWTDTRERRLGYMFQNPRLLPWSTVRDNVLLVTDGSKEAARRVDDLLHAMGLTGYADYHPGQISIGMQRRVALARAFVIQPQLLLMDEPFVSLDNPTAELLRELLLSVWTRHRSSVLFVTHDLREAVQLADRILFLSPSPAHLVGEVIVDLPREQRSIEAAVDTRYAVIRQEFDALYPKSGQPGASPPSPLADQSGVLPFRKRR